MPFLQGSPLISLPECGRIIVVAFLDRKGVGESAACVFDGRDCVSMVVETCLVGQRRDRLPMMALCFCFFLVLSGISTWRGGGATKGSNALFSSYIRISVAVLPCGGDFITWYVYILFRESS